MLTEICVDENTSFEETTAFIKVEFVFKLKANSNLINKI